MEEIRSREFYYDLQLLWVCFYIQVLLRMRKAVNINNYFNPRQNEVKIKAFELEFNRQKDKKVN